MVRLISRLGYGSSSAIPSVLVSSHNSEGFGPDGLQNEVLYATPRAVEELTRGVLVSELLAAKVDSPSLNPGNPVVREED